MIVFGVVPFLPLSFLIAKRGSSEYIFLVSASVFLLDFWISALASVFLFDSLDFCFIASAFDLVVC